MDDNQKRLYRLQEIKDRFAKVGWLKREDILWLLEVLGELLGHRTN
ncbi:hypothetical protein [uncultured Nostoc sp.]